jgi:hypothetical protein
MDKATYIIEDTSNRFWAVWPTNNENLDHVYYGISVKKIKNGFSPKAKARPMLVRKECTKIVRTL